MIKRFLIERKERLFRNKKAETCEFQGFDPANFHPSFLIITITFSNNNVVRNQVQLMDKYIEDKFTHLILDNSDIEAESKKIKETAAKFNRPYIRLTGNPHGRGSNSHGLALNWAYQQLVLRFRPAYFGFLDHDIYPVKTEKIIPMLDQQSIFGHLQERKPYWYLWPGLCFFKMTELFSASSNLAAGQIESINLDTGGMLYKSVYSKLNFKDIFFPPQHYERLREGNLTQSDQVEYIGNWIHSFNGSYWIKIKDKENELQNLINKYL
ncbi:MAG: hypothetical protein IAF38_19180 [Bacteroidia bacterium]|nr:hypothetical protein [Bacteroidia bacterium]